MSQGRRHARGKLFVAVGIDGPEERSGLGVTRNASMSGLLLATTRRFFVGDHVTLRVSRKGSYETFTVGATVKRLEREPSEAAKVFPWRIAVELDEQRSDLEDMVEGVDVQGPAHPDAALTDPPPAPTEGESAVVVGDGIDDEPTPDGRDDPTPTRS